ncbi:sigma-70 family RNA polymerase sigma factor [Nocardia sp. CDC159]|uniref:Sigma-70 family RNA polymerase sigma factor n=1 Tax=Nocardia pulmonis TaxID=2951408 RepID=A0A9X2EB66_9NOCA|nr:MULTISPECIES: sigma-70 family RNA polymerase sigma factor [Nocardia]MCM6777139.1 sigma-70 family RNA polymerase sigma factor [Nocardia pulmonis]MCM6790024.1 sigma-70 family RNA polymerase sigma factor [Nocardia sp. CDC159]
MNELDVLAERFENHRDHLRAVAYRMLGSITEAEDAVQEAWLRLAGADAAGIDNLGGWLTTVVGRVCLDMLRSRRSRSEEPLEPGHLPDPVVIRDGEAGPEQQALLADSIGMALLVVLESLTPAQRLAFVLHDMFALPFEQIAPIVDRTPQTAKKLASQARRRVRGEAALPDPDLPRQRRMVEAFLAAARDGDFDALLTLLDPDVVLRADAGAAVPGGMRVLRGAAVVAGQAETFRRMARRCVSHPVLVNGVAGRVNTADGALVSLMSFTVVGERITAIDILSDPDRLARLDLGEIVG